MNKPRKEFADVYNSRCPACGAGKDGTPWAPEYCERVCIQLIQIGDRGFTDGTTHASQREPHLHMTCMECGYEQTCTPHRPEETADRR